MVERRALIEGLKSIDKDIDLDLAEQFVYGKKPRSSHKAAKPAPQDAPAAAQAPAAPQPTPPVVEEFVVQKPLPESIAAAARVPTLLSPLTGIGRVPVGARVRTELAALLKRASLERQLQGIQPNSVQDIIENALELWLHKQGYLK